MDKYVSLGGYVVWDIYVGACISMQYAPYWVDTDVSAGIYVYHVCMRYNMLIIRHLTHLRAHTYVPRTLLEHIF